MSVASLEAPSAAVPSHVPHDRIFKFDMYQVSHGHRDFMDDVAAIRGAAPDVFYTPLNGGHWVITGYEALAEAARNTEVFSSTPYTIPTYVDEPRLAPLLVNPPAHTLYRGVLNKLFTARAAITLTDQIRASAAQFIDAVVPQGHCDFVASLAELLPVSVFLRILGLPLERLLEYRNAAKTYLGSADVPSKQKMADWIVAELSTAIAERQRAPRNDVISELLIADIDGRKPTFDEAVNFCMMLFVAGLDTVTVSMSYGIRYLAEDQKLQAWARANPRKIPDLVEELLRRFSAAQPARTLTRDMEIGDVVLKAGDRVLLLIAAANLDPKAFDNPLAVDPERPKKPHLAFNVGPHRCVGMHLARVELQIAYEEWLSRIPPFRVDTDKPQTASGGHVLALNNLALRWD